MSAETLPDCYAKMFPDVLHVPAGKPIAGKVLGVEIEKSGGLFPGGKRVFVREEQWDACRRCPQFEHCYQLSMAKLTFAAAVQSS
ncbi:MAG: hypothetical protein ACIALR_16370 [Blastopirellula sp. JB062]